jgi:hypothetical protein
MTPPAPQIHTGVFETKKQAVAPQAVKDVKIGGFGDPNGARPSENNDQNNQVNDNTGGLATPLKRLLHGGKKRRLCLVLHLAPSVICTGKL